MSKTYLKITGEDGQPVRDAEQARDVVRDFVRDTFPNKNPDNVSVEKLNDNGDWAAKF